MQNFETLETKLKVVIPRPKRHSFHMHCSSSSGAGSPPAKKGRKVEMTASQSYQNTKINPYLHEDHNPGGDKDWISYPSLTRRLTPPARLILRPGKKRHTGEQPVVLTLKKASERTNWRRRKKTEAGKTEGTRAFSQREERTKNREQTREKQGIERRPRT